MTRFCCSLRVGGLAPCCSIAQPMDSMEVLETSIFCMCSRNLVRNLACRDSPSPCSCCHLGPSCTLEQSWCPCACMHTIVCFLNRCPPGVNRNSAFPARSFVNLSVRLVHDEPQVFCPICVGIIHWGVRERQMSILIHTRQDLENWKTLWTCTLGLAQ